MPNPKRPSGGAATPRASSPSTIAPIVASTRLVPGPAAATAIIPKRGLLRRCLVTGTGLAQPNAGRPLRMSRPGRISVPNGSTWRIGLRLSRLRSLAVGSPSMSAVQPCATSWNTIATTRAGIIASAISRVSFIRLSDRNARRSPVEVQGFGEMPAAQRDVLLVSADLRLQAVRDRLAVFVETQVHRRLATAVAHRLELDQRVGDAEQHRRAGEQVAAEVGPQAVAQYRDVALVRQPRALPDLGRGEELRLVDQDAGKRGLAV